MMGYDYDHLTARLISLLDGDVLPLPTMWDLERHEQRIAIAVRDTMRMTPEHWATLDKPSREPWLEKTIAALMKQEDTSAEEKQTTPDPKVSKHFASDEDIERLHRKFLTLSAEPDSQKRGFAFESFLNDLFVLHGLDPRGAFRIVGEQIDGSFEWNGDTFLVEARWRKDQANAADLLVLRGKAEKSEWTRGLFISINGFADLATPTLQIGRKANLIAMSGARLEPDFRTSVDLARRTPGETASHRRNGGSLQPLAELKK